MLGSGSTSISVGIRRPERHPPRRLGRRAGCRAGPSLMRGWRGSTARSAPGCCCFRRGGGSRWRRPGGPTRFCCCCSRLGRWRCAAPAARSTTSPTATTTPGSRARGSGRCRAGGYGRPGGRLSAGAAGGRRGGAVQPEPAQHPARCGGARADRHLSVHEADHLLAAAFSRAQLQLGRADRLDRGDGIARPGRRCCCISAAYSGRSATTRSTRTRTRRTTSGSASNPRRWPWEPDPAVSVRVLRRRRAVLGRWPGPRPGSGSRSGPRLPRPRSSSRGRRRGSIPTTRPIASRKFRSNRAVGWLLLAGVVAGHFA